MKKLFYLIILVISIFAINVYATNDVSYTITITKDYDFKEVINYSLTDYKKITNGYNYFSTIVNDDIYTDIFYNTKYKKTKSKKGNAYKVRLSHTYNEYTMSNANFLNNCFENSSYDYDIKKISFTGEGDFSCFRGDSLKISLKTDFRVTDTNAVKNGNTYTWNPQSEDFTMNINIIKEYKETKESDPNVDDVDHARDPVIDGTDTNQNQGNNQTDAIDISDSQEKTKKSPLSIIITIVVLGIAFIILLIVLKNLKNKKDNLNQI